MEVDTETLVKFHNTLRDQIVPTVKDVRSQISGFIDTAGLFGNTDEKNGGLTHLAKDLSTAWYRALNWRYNETDDCIIELEALYSAIHDVGIEYEAVDEDAADGLYQHA